MLSILTIEDLIHSQVYLYIWEVDCKSRRLLVKSVSYIYIEVEVVGCVRRWRSEVDGRVGRSGGSMLVEHGGCYIYKYIYVDFNYCNKPFTGFLLFYTIAHNLLCRSQAK